MKTTLRDIINYHINQEQGLDSTHNQIQFHRQSYELLNETAKVVSLISTNDLKEQAALVRLARTVIITTEKLVQSIKDALGTAETGDALIEVARNAHKAEQELAALKRDDVGPLGFTE